MNMHIRNVAFFAGNEAPGRLMEELSERLGVQVHTIETTLPQAHETAAAAALEHNVILFRAQGDIQLDITAVKSLRTVAGAEVAILALSDANTSLEQARRLIEAGVDDVQPDTISGDALVAQIARISTFHHNSANAQNAAPAKTGKIIAVTAARGGLGSTTLATNLAYELTERRGIRRKTPKNSVAILDLDVQFGAVASFLDVEPRDGLYTIASEGTQPDDTFVSQSLSDATCGVSVFSAPQRPIPLDAFHPDQVSALLKSLQARFDYVVVDLPRTLVGWIGAVLSACDKVLLVTDMTVPTIRQARRLLDVYEEDNLILPLDVVVSGERKPLFMGRHHTEATKLLDRPLAHWLPDDRKNTRLAIDRGQVLADVAARSALRKSISKLASSLIAEMNGAAKQQATK
ncbi:MAG: CpaE family protein [Arenibacterium sp.]